MNPSPEKPSPASQRAASPETGGTLGSCLLWSVAVLLAVTAGVGLLVWALWPTPSEEDVQQAVVATIQREAPESFYVTGRLDLTVTSRVKNTKVLLPGVLDLDVGTTESTVRVPGRVFYGFDAATLRAEDISVRADGVVEVRLPALRVQAAEPDLSRMQIRTETGWTRLYDESRQQVEQQAIGRVQPLFRRQAREHLRTAREPQINTAEALRTMLTPTLKAAGIDDPRFRFRIGGDYVLEPAG